MIGSTNQNIQDWVEQKQINTDGKEHKIKNLLAQTKIFKTAGIDQKVENW